MPFRVLNSDYSFSREPDMRKLELSKEAVPENLRLFLGFVEVICSSARVDAHKCGDVKLAVEEACSNIITHGYAGRPPGAITLAGYREKDRLVVVISDQGVPFHPDGAPPPDLGADWEQRRVGGLGWHLIRKTVDTLSYETVGDENRLTLTVELKEA
jgi:anti-sigma regulatory factor (Ser/Thr protein kinase)